MAGGLVGEARVEMREELQMREGMSNETVSLDGGEDYRPERFFRASEEDTFSYGTEEMTRTAEEAI
jgi:hypothetical protein